MSTPPRSTVAVLLPALVALTTACDPGASTLEGAAATVRDSADIRIVESAPEWPLPEIWTVPEEPLLEIGEIEGEEPYLLDGVRSVVRDSQGRIVVLEFMSRLRWYDSLGVHLRTLEFMGEGPGEMQVAARLLRYRGDSLLVVGGIRGSGGMPPGGKPRPGASLPSRSAFGEFLVLDAEGAFGRAGVVWTEMAAPSDSTEGFANSGAGVAVLEDGSFLNEAPPVMHVAGKVGERVDAIYAVTLSNPEGAQEPDTVALALYGRVDLPLGGSDLSSSQRSPIQLVVLDPWVVHPVTQGNRIFLVNAEDGRVDVFVRGGDGSVRQSESWRPRFPKLPVTDALLSEYIEVGNTMYPRSEEAARANRSRLQQLGRADSLSVVEDVRIDANGHLWLAEGRVISGTTLERARSDGRWLEIERGPTRWTIFSPEGVPLGTVLTPAGFTIHQIRDDWVLGTTTDALGVQRIRLYALEKSAGLSPPD